MSRDKSLPKLFSRLILNVLIRFTNYTKIDEWFTSDKRITNKR